MYSHSDIPQTNNACVLTFLHLHLQPYLFSIFLWHFLDFHFHRFSWILAFITFISIQFFNISLSHFHSNMHFSSFPSIIFSTVPISSYKYHSVICIILTQFFSFCSMQLPLYLSFCPTSIHSSEKLNHLLKHDFTFLLFSSSYNHYIFNIVSFSLLSFYVYFFQNPLLNLKSNGLSLIQSLP